jgi:hypothetical protein
MWVTYILSCDWVTIDGVWIDNWIYWTLTDLTTNNNDSLTELHTPKITVTTAHIKYSQFAMSPPVVAWWWIPKMSSAMLTFLPADDCLTAHSLLQPSALKVKDMLWPVVSRPVCRGVKLHVGPKTRFLLLSDICGFVDVGRLQLLLAVISAVILGSESHRTHDHILVSPIWDSPSLEGQVPVFVSPRNRVAQLYPRHWVPFLLPPMTRRAMVEVYEPLLTFN